MDVPSTDLLLAAAQGTSHGYTLRHRSSTWLQEVHPMDVPYLQI